MYSDVLKSIADLLRFMRWPCGWLAAKVANQIIDSPIIEIMSSFAYIWIFFIFQRINSPKKNFSTKFFPVAFRVERPGTSITRHLLRVPVCYLDAHHLWLPPGNEGTSTRDFTEPPSQQQSTCSPQKKKCLKKKNKLKKWWRWLSLIYFHVIFTFKCGTGREMRVGDGRL